MGELVTHYIPLYGITGFFAAVFIFVPYLICKSPDKGIYRACIRLSAFCMWIFWVTIYIAQMNPIIGPRVSNETLAWIAHHWGDKMVDGPPDDDDDDDDTRTDEDTRF